MIVYDAHAHLHSREETELRQLLGIRTMISAGTPEQAQEAFEVAAHFPVHTVTAGLHPWYTAQFSPEDMRIYMEKTPLIGEIGMDCVWCDVPLSVQESAFIRQLDMAREMKKPVVLHTKGCEAQIARIISGYDMQFVVHWFSGSGEDLQPYLDMNCMFTIGPGIANDSCVQLVAARVPDDRLLFETDGMEAVSWAIGETPVEKLTDVLENSVRIAAGLRNADAQMLAALSNDNYMRLLNS